MRRSYRRYLLLSICYLSACTGYLDVQPKDQYEQVKVFRKPETIQQALRGIYLQLATPRLYGHTLTMGALDVMGQYYACDAYHAMHGFQQLDYTDARVQAEFSETWRVAYNTVLNVNSFIHQLKAADGVIAPHERNRYLGEAYGIRAMLHFDLLRIFGPVLLQDPDGPAIPYQTFSGPEVEPISTANAVLAKLFDDLDTARHYLAEDPIRSADIDEIFFHNNRFNYYAALALDARISLYANRKERALNCAVQVISDAPERFPWADTDEADVALFASEIIFRLDHPELLVHYNNSFSATLNTTALLSPLEERLQEVYKHNPVDVRYRRNWQFEPVSFSKAQPIFIKYRAGAGGYVPLLRMSEAFLIAAECTADTTLSYGWLDKLNLHRSNQPAPRKNREDLFVEQYRAEFWGEGQLYFCLKRLYRQQIPNANDALGIQYLTASHYIAPLPKDETSQR